MTLRLLINSDKITGMSAYSRITRELCIRTLKLGHKVGHVPMGSANKMGHLMRWGVLIHHSGDDPFNEDVIIDYYVQWKADMLIAIKEPWVLRDMHKWAINFVPYAIIDHSPVSPLITSRLQTAFRILCPSHHAQRELIQAGFERERICYVPHGVDCSKFKQLEDKAACRRLFGLQPDDYVIGIVAMNRVRKMIPQMMKGYKRFLEMNPDVKNVHLFLWTNVYPTSGPSMPIMGVSDVGVNLLNEMHNLGIAAGPNDARWMDPNSFSKLMRLGGLKDYDPNPDEPDLIKLYNSFDVHLAATGGEGFGLTLIEAQACGVPVIATEYAAAPEQVGAGLTVMPSDYIVINTPGTRYAIPDADGIAEALTKIYNADPEKLARRARIFALRYDWNRIIDQYWKPFLEEAETELKPLLVKGEVKTWA